MRDRFSAIGHSLKSRLSVAGDLIILNLLTILCSIPVITAGAAGVACYTGIYRIIRGERTGLPFGAYFQDFKDNFKKSTAIWLIELFVLALLAGDLYFALAYETSYSTFFLIFAIVLAAVVLLAGVWLYPLIARFENKTGAYIKNSLLMTVAQFPKTFCALLLQAFFFLVPATFLFYAISYYIIGLFGWLWALCGASLPMYLTAKLFAAALQLKPIEGTDTDK